MMKDNAGLIHVDTTVGFLAQRQQFIDLCPSKASEPSGYVWRRVFLRGKRRA